MLLVTPVYAVEADPFPRPAGLEADIAFWKSIFGDINSSQALLHDNRYLGVVYEVVEIPPGVSTRERNRLADKVRGRYRTVLQSLGKGKRTNLSAEEQRVLDLWPADVSNAELQAASKRIRFQQGLSDRYLAGLKRSGRWRGFIEQQFSERDLPIGLSALPHVESSFNPEAHSHVGASGLWQFTSGTGRRFMEIDHVVDERRDPFYSSEAAAELLAYNYSILKSWPLALTAYNHGVAGMRRAVRNTGTDDFTVINQTYKGRTFGFASRNFYLAFIAALEVEQEAEKYFGKVQKDIPSYDLVIEMPSYASADSVAEALGVSTQTLRSYNPALLDPVWNGTKHVPKGYEVRVPASLVDVTEDEILAAIPSSQWFAQQTPDMYHKIRPGESLSVIASRYDTSVTRLMQLNSIKSRHRIRAGQTLRLPYAGVSIPANAETYTVRNGDSVSKIASRVGVNEADLMAMNQIRDRNRIYVGQVLYLRQQAESRPAAPSPVQVASVAPAEPEAKKPQPVEQKVVAKAPVEKQKVAEVLTAKAPVEQQKTAEVLAAKAPAEEQTTEEVLTASIDASPAAEKTEASRADPNDYSVGTDNTIEVQAAETLGHYADWLKVRTQRLRDLNELNYRRPVVVGHRIQLDLSQVDVGEFTNQRVAFHRDLQEAFFSNYRVVNTTEHKLKRGESVWVLTHRNYKVPVWLVRQYNPDLDFGQVRPGMRIVFPLVERVDHQARNRAALADAS